VITRRAALVVAGAAGLSAIALGSFGAHALKSVLALHHSVGYWHTAVLYHLVHSVALLWAADSTPMASGSVLCWGLGILIFCGSLYLLALTGFTWLGAVTPVGGLFLMGGWLIVMIRRNGKDGI